MPILARTRVERHALPSQLNNDSSAPVQDRPRSRASASLEGGDAASGACEITHTTGLPTCMPPPSLSLLAPLLLAMTLMCH